MHVSINKKVLLGIAGVGVLFAVVMGIVFYKKQGPLSPIYAQINALKANDMAKAYSYTSKDFQHVTSLSDFESFINYYPSLKENTGITLEKPALAGSAGEVKGVLNAAGGIATPIDYLLIKEDDDWKILGIQITPVEASENLEGSKEEASADPRSVTKLYDNTDSRYTIKYPTSWIYEKSSDGTIIFSGRQGSPAYFSTINVQTVLTKKSGGDYTSIKQFMADIKRQAMTESPTVKFLEKGSVTVNELDGTKDTGEFMVFTYKYKGKFFKQWQVVVMRHDKQVFYAWAYTAPVEQYDIYAPIAKAMFASWVIY